MPFLYEWNEPILYTSIFLIFMFFMDNQLYASRPFFTASYLKDSWCSNYALFMLSVVPLKTFFRSEKTPSLALTRGFGNVFLKIKIKRFDF